MSANFPPCPQSLKSIQHYLKTAAEHEERDIVVCYWSRLYALQTALKIDKKSDDARLLLVALMDWLEKTKKTLADNDAISNEVAAEAHIENYALKLFTWADSQDRAGVFNKNVVKAFYTAGMLMDILLTFGEHTEEVARNCKYAKWKAAYIHNCLKNGETPIPGPMGSEGADDNASLENNTSSANIGFQVPPDADRPFITPRNDVSPSSNVNFDPFSPASVQPPAPSVPAPESAPPATPHFPPADVSSVNSGDVPKLDPSVVMKAQKYCKFAGSALNYDDIPEAISNLKKALHLLETGQEL